jgi:gliding motility-associated-like protein
MLKRICFLLVFQLSYTIPAFCAEYLHSGIDIRYVWLYDSTYKITATVYVNCDIANWNNSLHTIMSTYGNVAMLCRLPDTCSNTIKEFELYTHKTNLSDGRPNGSPMLKPCIGFGTQCDTPLLPNSAISYYIYEFEWTYTLPSKCGLWNIAFKPSQPAFHRDSLLTNIEAGHWYYVDIGINNLDTNYKNNSATIINPFPFYAPINQPFTYSLKAHDVDGDSLVYHLVHTKDQYASCGYPFGYPYPYLNIPFKPPFTLSEPFTTNGTFVWDSVNAIISFTAPYAQNPLITLVIDEYRNGVWVGNSMHDIPIVILPYSYSLPQASVVPSSFVNTGLQGVDSFYACSGMPMSFCTMLSSANSNAEIVVTNNVGSAIPSATMAYTNLYTDSVLACFQWAPALNDTGWHSFTVHARDTTCAALGVNTEQSFVYRIYVSKPVSIQGSNICCAGDTIILSAHGGNGTYNWSGASSSFTCLNAACDSIKVYPSQTTSYYVQSGNNPFCSSDSITIKYYSDFTIKANDTTLCVHPGNIMLSSTSTPANATLLYTWIPTTNIIGSNITSNINIIPSSITYTITATDSVNCFTHTDFASVQYDTEFAPQLYVSDTILCNGDTAMFSLTGVSTASILWSPNTHISGITDNPMFANPDTPTNYQVTVISNISGCMFDSSVFIHASQVYADAGADRTINGGAPTTLGGTAMRVDPLGKLRWYPNEYIHFDNLKFPVVFPPKTKTYYVVLENKFSTCISTDTVHVIVKCSEVFMPSVFYPASEYIENRTFGVRNQMLSIRYLKIYNRWGNLVYTTSDISKPWNGTFKGTLAPTDTYHWMMSGTCPDGSEIFQKGDVLLLR